MDEIEFQVVIEVLWYLPNLLQLYCIQNHHCPLLKELKTSLTLSLFFHLSSHNRECFFRIFQESGGNCKGRVYDEQKGHIISTSPLMPNCKKGGLFCSYLYLINFAIIQLISGLVCSPCIWTCSCAWFITTIWTITVIIVNRCPTDAQFSRQTCKEAH